MGESGFRRGRRLGLDVGSVRIGVAQCDPDGILATPAGTVYRRDGDERALRELAALVAEYEPIELVAGLPASLDGQRRASAESALSFLAAVARAVDVPIRLIDERFTTAQAHGMMQAAGRSSRQRRESVDAASAVLILQAAVDAEKRSGSPAGQPFETPAPDSEEHTA